MAVLKLRNYKLGQVTGCPGPGLLAGPGDSESRSVALNRDGPSPGLSSAVRRCTGSGRAAPSMLRLHWQPSARGPQRGLASELGGLGRRPGACCPQLLRQRSPTITSSILPGMLSHVIHVMACNSM